jgi:hypothetical protein
MLFGRVIAGQPGTSVAAGFKCFAHPAQALCEPLWFVQLSFGGQRRLPGAYGISEAAIGLIEANTMRPLGV